MQPRTAHAHRPTAPPGYRILTREEFVRRLTERRSPEERSIWQDLLRVPAVRWERAPEVTAYLPLTRW